MDIQIYDQGTLDPILPPEMLAGYVVQGRVTGVLDNPQEAGEAERGSGSPLGGLRVFLTGARHSQPTRLIGVRDNLNEF